MPQTERSTSCYCWQENSPSWSERERSKLPEGLNATRRAKPYALAGFERAWSWMRGVLRREQQPKAVGWADEQLVLLRRHGVGRWRATGRWWWMVVAAPIVATRWRRRGGRCERSGNGPPTSAIRASILSVSFFFPVGTE